MVMQQMEGHNLLRQLTKGLHLHGTPNELPTSTAALHLYAASMAAKAASNCIQIGPWAPFLHLNPGVMGGNPFSLLEQSCPVSSLSSQAADIPSLVASQPVGAQIYPPIIPEKPRIAVRRHTDMLASDQLNYLHETAKELSPTATASVIAPVQLKMKLPIQLMQPLPPNFQTPVGKEPNDEAS
ncbi:uncharacterized protein LOC131996891 [Stomoxys calcitrans]|uniref:uncharacterized protein LOC131996891 n=1 Tax=Stomoxys calcitrans TaxID=35570 RepID=UPI0027E2E16C|nr:uncharacterized protein LOC131996891 [Stomoxys calcitrans]